MATTDPLPTPRRRRCRASLFARTSRSEYVVCSRPKTTATAWGRRSARVSKIVWRTPDSEASSETSEFIPEERVRSRFHGPPKRLVGGYGYLLNISGNHFVGWPRPAHS